MSEVSKGVLLVVDDEPLKRITLQIELSQAGYTVLDASDAETARRHLHAKPVDVVITDVRMPQTDGLQLLDEIRAHWPRTHVILMTAYGTIDSAVSAIKRGAYDYITKPFSTDALLQRLDRLRAVQGAELHEGNGEPLPPQELPVAIPVALAGQSYAVRQLIHQVGVAAASDSAIWLEGENGTPRDQVAQLVHQLGRRSGRPMVRLHCATCPPGVLETTLLARLEQANGGTLFIEAVDCLPAELQSRLVHILDCRQFDRSDHLPPVTLDVRLICSAGEGFQQAIDSRQFRRDLYHRLSVIHLAVPALRDRREDIPVLAEAYLRHHAGQAPGRQVPVRVSQEALEALLAYDWPGNLREFEHVLERAISLATGSEIALKDILLPRETADQPAQSSAGLDAGLTETINGIERALIDAALAKAAGNQARAAQILRIPRTTLRDKMAKYGMVHTPKSPPA